MSGRVMVVGSVNVDLVVTVPWLPAAGETVTGGRYARHDGGKGGNQAVAAARLGATTVLIGVVGDDAHGSDARAALVRAGVDVELLAMMQGTATGVAVIVVADGGENQIAVAPGANERLDPEVVRAALGRLAPQRGDVVLVGHEIPTATARAALAAARLAGATTVLNPAPASGLDGAMLALADVLTPNRGELATMVSEQGRRTGRVAGGEDAARAAARLVDAGPEGAGAGAVLVTLGAAGALLVRRAGEPVSLPAPRVEAIDATGAGDALSGALAAALASGLDLETAARRAVTAASLSTRRAGAREGLPTAAEVDATLASATEAPRA